MVLKGIIFGFQSNGELRLDECLNLGLWPFKGLSVLKGASWLGGFKGKPDSPHGSYVYAQGSLCACGHNSLCTFARACGIQKGTKG